MQLLRFLKERHPLKKSSAISGPVYVYANQKNAGDLLSAKGIQAAVGVEGAEYLIEDGRPHNFLRSEKVKQRKLIIGGGGLLMDVFEPFWQELLSSGSGYMLFGVGACNIRGRARLLPDKLLKDIVLNAWHVQVRDSMTADLIEAACGIKPLRTLCPSVYYVINKYNATPVKKDKRCRTKLLYVHHRKLVETAGQGENFVKDMVKTICRLNDFIFVETDNMSGNIDKLMGRYINSDIIISTRLHGCIFSYALNKPFVAVSADSKIDSFAHDYCSSAATDINRISADMLNSIVLQRLSLSPRRDDFLSFVEEIRLAGEFIKKTFPLNEQLRQP